MKLKKTERHHEIKKAVNKNPFITDSGLRELFNVSIQTICLDYTQLNIFELRKRTKSIAKQSYEYIKGSEVNEVIGDLIQVKPSYFIQSIIEITEKYMFQETHTARGHILSAQANSLCVALIHNSTVSTQESSLKFTEKVKLHDNVRAKTTVINRTNRHYDIEVESPVKDILAFTGIFKTFCMSEDENHG